MRNRARRPRQATRVEYDTDGTPMMTIYEEEERPAPRGLAALGMTLSFAAGVIVTTLLRPFFSRLSPGMRRVTWGELPPTHVNPLPDATMASDATPEGREEAPFEQAEFPSIEEIDNDFDQRAPR